MRTRSKLLLAATAAVLTLSITVSTASATRLSVSEQQFRMVWQPMAVGFGEISTRCNLTLEGSFFASTFAKTSGVRIGRTLFRAGLGPCSAGSSVTLLSATLPWDIYYESFTGRLPTIERVNFLLVNASFNINFNELVICLFRSKLGNPVRLTATLGAGGAVSNFVIEYSAIPTEGPGICPTFYPSGEISAATGTLSRQGTTTPISIALI